MRILQMPEVELASPLSQSQRESLNTERKRLRVELYKLQLLEQRIVSLLCEDGHSEETVKIEVHG